MGKRTAQKDTIIDITSDSQVKSNFPYRWSPASLTFNNYFYLFKYLYITWITINNSAPYLKSPKTPNRRAALGRPAIKITGVGGGGGLYLVCGRPTLALGSALVHQTKQLQQKQHTTKQEQTTKSIKTLNIHFYLFFLIFYHESRQRVGSYAGGHNASRPQTNS